MKLITLRQSFLIIFLIMLSGRMYAQDFGQNNPNIRWKQLQTSHFKIIFPDEITADAQRVANTLEYLIGPLEKSLFAELKPWTLILSNRGAIANGYVTVAPRKSEWYATPAQGILTGSGDWYNLLATHEGRHMVQFDKLNSGLTKLLSVLFGQQAQYLSFFCVPGWFWEGDAVGTETALSATGRGRMPEFTNGVKSKIVSEKADRFHVSYLPSFTEYRPNAYELGYLLTTHVKSHYPEDTWGKVLSRTAKISVFPWRFAGSLKKYTGKSSRKQYKEMVAALDTLWKNQVKSSMINDAQIIKRRKNKVWTIYNFPHYLDEDNIVALKSGLADPYTIVKINLQTGEETKIKQVAAYDGVYFDGTLACWNDYCLDHRWENENYSDIVVLDLITGKQRFITRKGKYFVPAIHQATNRVAAVRFTPERNCFLDILNATTGEQIASWQSPGNDFLQGPAFSDDGSKVVFTRQKFNGKALMVLDVNTMTAEEIIPETWENINAPFFYENFIIYETAIDGMDNIYAVEMTSKQKFRVLSRPFGAYNAEISPDGKSIIYSDHQVRGHDIAVSAFNPEQWLPVEDIKNLDIRYYEPLIGREQGGNILNGVDSIPGTPYTVKKYNQTAHLLNIHSWAVIPNFKGFDARIVSNDLLNTTAITAGGIYNFNEKSWVKYGTVSYMRYYPVFSLSGSTGERFTTFTDSLGNKLMHFWDETSLFGGITIPYSMIKGIYTHRFTADFDIGYTRVKDKNWNESFSVNNGSFIPFFMSVNYSGVLQSAYRDINARFSQNVQLTLNSTPFDGDYRSKQLSINGNFTFPGLFRHHSLQLNGGMEMQHPDNYRFASNVAFVRGYDYEYNDFFGRAAVTYHLPLFYTEWNIGSIIYIKRFRAGAFYDYGFGENNSLAKKYRSAGAAILFDCNLFKLPADLSGGVRYSYLVDERHHKWDFIFIGLDF